LLPCLPSSLPHLPSSPLRLPPSPLCLTVGHRGSALPHLSHHCPDLVCMPWRSVEASLAVSGAVAASVSSTRKRPRVSCRQHLKVCSFLWTSFS
jgi:hypothetical protein